MPLQPTLPAEGAFTEAEQNFIENSPPGLWPENQNSNFGQIRKVLTDIIQACIDEINHLSDEAFVPTASEYLSLWEELANVPIAPTGKTDIQRRAVLLPRLKYGLFTRDRINKIVENYITATFGAAASFGASGIPFGSGGIPLFSGTSSLIGTYRIYYDVRNFSYAVWIKNTVVPDIASLTKELARITPAGITSSVDNTPANVLHYAWTIRNDQPVLHLRLGDNADLSGYGAVATANGGLVFGNTVSILPLPADTAVDLDGVDDNISVPSSTPTNVEDFFSVEFWINADSFANNPYIFDRGANAVAVYVDTLGQVRLVRRAVVDVARSSAVLSTGVTYHVVVTKSGAISKIYVNGVEGTVLLANSTMIGNTSETRIGMATGASNFFNGRLDEVALYNYPLSPAQVARHYNTGVNVAT